MSCSEIAFTILGVLGLIATIWFGRKQINEHKIESNKKNLNNIIDWANSVKGWEYSTAVREPRSMEWHRLYVNYASVLKGEKKLLSIILRNGTRMSIIASVFKNETLDEIIKNLIKEMSTTLQELEYYIDSVTPRPGFIYPGFEPPEPTRLKEQKIKQDELANKLIDTVSEIIPTYY